MANINNVNSNTILSGTSDNDFIHNYSGSNVYISGGAGSDVIGTGTNYYDSSSGKNITINGGTGDDFITGMSGKGVLYEYTYGDGNDFINGFNSNDTLRIYNSNYNTMISGNDFIVFVGSGSITLKNSANISVKIIDAYGYMTTYNPNPLNLLQGSDYADVITNTNKVSTVLGYAGNDTLWNYADNVLLYGGDGHDDIHNTSDNVGISGGNGADSIESTGNNGLIYGDAGNDTISVSGTFNSLSGGKGNDLIILDAEYSNNAINYSLGDGNDTVYGFNSSDVLWAYDTAWTTSTIGNDVVLSFQSGSVVLKDTATIHPRLALNVTNNVTVGTIGAGTEIIDASTRTKAIKITCNELANELYGGSGKDSLYGGSGNDLIFGNAGNDKLYGEDDDDTLSGDKGNDTLKGGAGNDLFIYSAGNDVITDYAAGDTISLGAAVSKATISGSDVVFTIGKGSLKVKNAKDKTLGMIDSTGKSFSTIVGGSTTLKVTNSTKSPVTVGSAIKTVNASSRTKAVKITGNSLANTITGGSGKDSLYGGKGNDSIVGGKGNDKLYGQAGNDVLKGGKGNDSLWGGAGNDSLYGGDGKDTFIYTAGEGSDKIFDYSSGDMLKILKSNGKAGSFSKSKFSGGTLSLTIAGGGKVIFDDVAKGDKFNINGTNYKISGSKLK